MDLEAVLVKVNMGQLKVVLEVRYYFENVP